MKLSRSPNRLPKLSKPRTNKGSSTGTLKPANIKVRSDGTVKVLDFGLAKALEPIAARADATASPTITSPAMMTGVGMLLGTAAYMSPEQARGKAVDKRSDIWAFGCVLYEMVTGKQAFRGEDITETLASVVKAEPDWDVLPADTPSNIRTLLFRCLQKDIKKRVRDAGDIVIECEQAVTTSATVVATPLAVVPIFSRRSVVIGLAGLLLGGFITGLAVWRLTLEPMAPVSRFTVMLPLGQRLADGPHRDCRFARRETPRLCSDREGGPSSFTCGRWTAWRESR